MIFHIFDVSAGDSHLLFRARFCFQNKNAPILQFPSSSCSCRLIDIDMTQLDKAFDACQNRPGIGFTRRDGTELCLCHDRVGAMVSLVSFLHKINFF